MYIAPIKTLPMRFDYHVIPVTGGWAVTHEGTYGYTKVNVSKLEATGWAVTQARAGAVSVILHGRDGRIQEVWSY